MAAAGIGAAHPAHAIKGYFRGGVARASGGGGTGSPLTTRTFVNTTGSTITGPWFSPLFGMHFKNGDIPSGHYPSVQVSGVTQALSIGLESYWSDGSLRTCSGFIRCTSTLGGSGSVTVTILDGGIDKPTALGSPGGSSTSALTTTTLRNQLIQVNVTGLSFGSNLSGNYCAQFFNTNKTQLEEYKLIDGAAGVVYRCMADFVPSNGSFVPSSATAHGRVVAYGYIAMLENSGATLAGFRFLPRITQPYYSDSPSATKGPAAFSTVQWQYGAGPTTNSFTFPFTAKTATATNGSTVFTTSAAHGYYAGQGDWGTIGCYLTAGSGSLPINASDASGSITLNTSTLYYLAATGLVGSPITIPTTQLRLSRGNGAMPLPNNGYNITPTAGGTFQINPCLVCNTFGSIFGATTDAKWNYFQGAGNQAADAAVISNLDSATAKPYLKSTGLIPPFDLAQSYTADSDTSSWTPANIGPCTADQEAPADRDDLGPWTGWAVRYLFNQNIDGELLTRKIGYAGAHQSQNLRDLTLRTLVNVAEAAAGSSFTGMPSSLSTTFQWNPKNVAGFGFTAPAIFDTLFGFSQNNPSHHPALCYPAYLIWGEPQFLDLHLENANAQLFWHVTSDRNQANPTQKYAMVVRWGDEGLRSPAWGFRDIVQAAIIAPGKRDGSVLAPDGSAVSKYFNTAVSTNASDFNDVMAGFNSYCQTAKYWMPSYWGASATPTNFMTANGWQRAYLLSSVALCYKGCESPDALTALNNFSTWTNYIYSHFGNSGYHLANFEEHNVVSLWNGSGVGTAQISSDNQFGIEPPGTKTFGSTSPHFAVTLLGSSNANWTLSTNDIIAFNGRDSNTITTSPAGQIVADSGFYYIRDLTNLGGGSYTFNIAATAGGTRITVTNSGAFDPFIQLTNPPGAGASNSYPNDTEDLALALSGVRAMIACGVSPSLTSVQSDLATRSGLYPASASNNARFKFTTSF